MTKLSDGETTAESRDGDGRGSGGSFRRQGARDAVPAFLDIREVAALFGRAPRTIRWWIFSGRLAAVRVGRTPFVPETELRKLLGKIGDCEPSSGGTDGVQEADAAAENDASDGAKI